MRIRTQLVLLVAGALLPVAIFAAIMTARFWDLQREAYDQQFLERVRALRIALDTELDATVRTLLALGNARDFANPPALDSVALRLRNLIAAQPGWETMGVLLPEGDEVTAVFRDSRSLLVPDPETVAQVLRTRGPAISNIVATSDPPAYTTYVAVPVIRDERILYVLYAGIDHRAWLAFLQKYPIAPQATLTLNDRDGRIIARTLNDERWVGRRSMADYVARMRAKEEDSFRSIGLEGQAFYSAFSRLSRSGWTLGTGVPQAEVESALHGSSMLVLAGIAIAMALALALALLMGRRIAGEIGWLAAFAKSMAEPGQVPAPRELAMSEAARVRTALADTGRQLAERQSRLNDALAREAQARAAAENASRAKDHFLAMLGHELRNPLSAIATAAALLQTGAAAKHLARSTEIIARQVRHLTAIVDELLDVARITGGKVVLAREIVDLAAIAREAVAALEDSGRAPPATIECRFAPAYVYGDEARLEQIVTNLVDNALKYSGPAARILVDVHPGDGDAVLEVRDNGRGIPADLLPRIFDLFEQGERTHERAQGGLGVGLTVVRALVDQHGGTIVAASAGPGKGSVMTVRIPRVRAPSSAPLPSSGAAPVARRILVVDDNADNLQSLAALLQDRGHEVSTAADGPGALAAIDAIRPQIAVLDIGLPGFDGAEVARRVRARPELGGVRLIALSGYGNEDNRAAALAAGFDAYLVKPFEYGRFEALLDRRR